MVITVLKTISLSIVYLKRTNRTQLKGEFYAVGALRKGKSTNAPYEEDLLLHLGIESISEITFFSRLKVGEAVFHSRAYKRVSRRNNFTVAYHKGETIAYGQIEEFFIVEDKPGLVCGAVIATMPIDGSCISKNNQMLGARPVNHIVCLRQPDKNRFDVVSPEGLLDVCVYMKFSDTVVGYAAHFANHIEKD